MRAAVYTRISRDPGNDRLAVQRQAEDCERICAERGWEPVPFEDDDESASRVGTRPRFSDMLRAIEAGEVTAIVAWHPDRLYRHPQDLERLVTICEAHRVPIATCMAGHIDLSTASGRMVARLLGAVARHEVEHLVERLKRKHVELAANGVDVSQSRPYGYTRDRTALVPAEVAVIREAADRLLGGETLGSVTRDLQARGVRGANGAPMGMPALRKTLTSARISGRREMRRIDGRPVDIGLITSETSTIPAIISHAQSDRLRALFGARRRPESRKYLLTAGIAICGLCGAHLSVQPKAGALTLVCRSFPQKGCGSLRILMAPVDELVTEVALQLVDDGRLSTLVEADRDDRDLLDELARVDGRLAELARDWAAGRLSRVEWDAATDELHRIQRDLQQQVEARRRRIGLDGIPELVRQAWPELALHQRRAVLKALIERVVIHPARVRGRRVFDPSRVEIVGRV